MIQPPFDNIRDIQSLLKMPGAFTPQGFGNLESARSGTSSAISTLSAWNSTDYIPSDEEVLSGYTPGMFDSQISSLTQSMSSFDSIDTNVFVKGVPKSVAPGDPGSLNINRLPTTLSIAKSHKSHKEMLNSDDSCTTLADIMGSILGGLEDFVNAISDGIKDVMDIVGQGLKALLDAGTAALDALISTISGAATEIIDAISEELSKFKKMLEELFDFGQILSFPSLGLDPCTAQVLKEVASVGLLAAGAYAATKIAGKGQSFF